MHEQHATQRQRFARKKAMVMLASALLGSLLVLFAACSTGPTGPTLPASRGWRLVSNPNPGSILNNLQGVAVVSPSDAWAVGYSSRGPGGTLLGQATEVLGGQTLIEHWNGARWSIVPSPNPGSTANGLKAVAAVSTNDVWAVGYFSSSGDSTGRGLQTAIEHWNGTQWSAVPSPSPGSIVNILNGVADVSANDAWAVGYSSSGNFSYKSQDGPIFNFVQERTLIEHWNGTQWNIISTPNVGPYNNFLSGVARDPHSGAIWAVGAYGEGYTPERTITEVWSA